MKKIFPFLFLSFFLISSKIIVYKYEDKSNPLYITNYFETLDEAILNISTISDFKICKIFFDENAVINTLSLQNVNITRTIIFSNNHSEIRSQLMFNKTQFLLTSNGSLKFIGFDLTLISQNKKNTFLSINMGQLIVQVIIKKISFGFDQ